MSLNFDLSKIRNHESLWLPGDRLNPVTESLVFLTMFVGMNAITEKNCTEFYARVMLLDRTGASFVYNSDGNPVFITARDIRAHIGLHTNASTFTHPEFLRRQAWKVVFGVAEKEMSHELASADA